MITQTDETARCLAALGAGANLVKPPALGPADTLLDLYGENIRARAYVVADADGERMLRPDFTVPVVEAHLAAGGGAGAYAYAGTVWRRQAPGSGRAREFVQVGREVFSGDGAEAADAQAEAEAEADIFARIAALVEGAGLEAEIGDLGLLSAAIDSLQTTQTRRAALKRHLWRPARFQRLLDRFSTGHAEFVAEKAALVAALRAGRLEEHIAAAGQPVGLRGAADIAARVGRLADEAATAPIGDAAVDRIRALLALECPCSEAGEAAARLAEGEPALEAAAAQLSARLQVFARRGLPLDTIRFKGSFGRTSLEYYDGFVFGFFAPGRDDLPVIASGGRFDALVRAMGGTDAAVGGIVRPEALIAAERGRRC